MPRGKNSIIQFDWRDGMDLLSHPLAISQQGVRVLEHVETRTGFAFKSKGKVLESLHEFGGRWYDQFLNDYIDVGRWLETDAGSNVTIATGSTGNRLQITGNGSTNANGVTSTTIIPQDRTGAYVQLDIISPSTLTSEFRVVFVPTVALGTGDGLEIQFASGGNINRIEDGVSTDTTQDWAVSTTYRLKVVKESDGGWKASLSTLSATTFDNVQLFDTTFVGNNPAYLALQTITTTTSWQVRNVEYHDGYATGAKAPVRSLYRFYRPNEPTETLVAMDDALLSWDGRDARFEERGLNTTRRFDFTSHRGVAYAANGVDKLRRKAFGADWETVDEAPVVEFIEQHLERIFGASGNTLYWSDFINPLLWDTLDDSVDMDSWKGDSITRLVRIGPVLYIFKARSVWQLLGFTVATFQLLKIPGAKGCPYPWSVASDGVSVIYMGSDGFYRLVGNDITAISGTTTVSQSQTLHGSSALAPMFKESAEADYHRIVLGQRDGPVGVVHDFRYRCSVELTGQATQGINNAELVYDMLSGERGAWSVRPARFIDSYVTYDGEGDRNQLIVGNSNSDGGLYRMEVGYAERQSEFNPVDRSDSQAITIASKIITRRNTGTDGVTNKHWHDFRPHFVPTGNYNMTVKYKTNRSTGGATLTQSLDGEAHLGATAADSTFTLDATGTLLEDPFARKKPGPPASLAHGSNHGEEVWFEFTHTGANDWRLMGYECEFEETNQ